MDRLRSMVVFSFLCGLGVCLGFAGCTDKGSLQAEKGPQSDNSQRVAQQTDDWPGNPQPSQETAGRKDRHALLVGVTFYENLPKDKHLQGPANDVLLVRRLLLEKLQFQADLIRVLSEAEGKRRGKDFFPSRANIEREFRHLAQVAKPGDQVVIHMGGHGSQQPENKDSPDPEPDGLDEIFLPRDVGAWVAKKESVKNAIIDDEIGAWLKTIRDKKASVWITFDSCHSGTMIRGGNENEKVRNLDPVRDLGIPPVAIKEAVARAAKREAAKPERARGREGPVEFKLAKGGGIVAIYACHSNEETVEYPLPRESPDAKYHGLLTYVLCKILTEATERSKEPITYNELARRIYGQYIQWGRTCPVPLIEGVDQEREVLGEKVWPGRSAILLTKGKTGYTINAGALHGLTPGSILAVKPPPGKGDTSLGHVRLNELAAHVSKVDPCAYADLPLAKNLPDGGACTLAFIDFGEQQLRVAVDPLDAEHKLLTAELRAELGKTLQALAGPGSLVRPVQPANGADWLVRASGKNVVLAPGSGWPDSRAPFGEPAFGPAPIDGDLANWLKDALSRIARAEYLTRFAATSDLGGTYTSIHVNLAITRVTTRNENGKENIASIPIAWPAPDVLAYDEDLLVFDLANKGRVPIDITAFYINSGFGIKCLYPRQGNLNRLLPEESLAPWLPLRFDNKTVGLEHLVVIATKANGQPVDFSLLEQPTLEQALNKAGTRSGAFAQSLDTPLGKLLQRGMFGEGQSRGATWQQIEDYVVFAVSFNVRPGKRPTNPKLVENRGISHESAGTDRSLVLR